MAWQDTLPLALRSVKGTPIDAVEIDLNFSRIGAMLCDLAAGHDHDGVNSKNLSVVISIDNFPDATIVGGALQSSDWGALTGMKIDLLGKTIKIGGSAAPRFAVNSVGVLTAISAVLSGTITSSNISGSALSSSTLDIGGTDATSFHVDINGNVWSGAATFAAAPFSVSYLGVMKATNATITGTITGSVIRTAVSGARILFDTTGISAWNADPVQTVDINVDGSGWFGLTATRAISWTAAGAVQIAGFNLTATGMWVTAAGNTSSISAIGNVFAAGPTGSPAFYVTAAGVLHATGAIITGAILAATIDIGSQDDSSFHVDLAGNIWSGAALFANAAFSVNYDGRLITHDATIDTDNGRLVIGTISEGVFGIQAKDAVGTVVFELLSESATPFLAFYADTQELELEMMKVNFQAISWAQFAIYDAFADESKRSSSDPSAYPARVYRSYLDNGGDNTNDRAFGFVSKTYANITTIESGTASAVDTNSLTDTSKNWFIDQCRNLTLIDSVGTAFTVTTNTSDTLTIVGTPVFGAYTLVDNDPAYAVVFASYLDSSNGGYGYTRIEVSFDGGTHYQTFLDTSDGTDFLQGTMDVNYPGQDYLVRITLTNDGSGNGAILYKFLACTDPSPWRF